MARLGTHQAPAPQRRGSSSTCRRSCCWTPYGCGKQTWCACHHPDDPAPPNYTFEVVAVSHDPSEDEAAWARVQEWEAS